MPQNDDCQPSLAHFQIKFTLLGWLQYRVLRFPERINISIFEMIWKKFPATKRYLDKLNLEKIFSFWRGRNSGYSEFLPQQRMSIWKKNMNFCHCVLNLGVATQPWCPSIDRIPNALINLKVHRTCLKMHEILLASLFNSTFFKGWKYFAWYWL